MPRIIQPMNVKTLTDVSVVRLKKCGKRFEIACYKNKVQDWRLQREKDIDEVLRRHVVYTSVSKGIVAKPQDLQECFGTTDQEKICLDILSTGEVQTGELERESTFANAFRDVATIIAAKRPFPVPLVEQALRDIHFPIDPAKGIKKQALDAIRALKEASLPFDRAEMRVHIRMPADTAPLVWELGGKGRIRGQIEGYLKAVLREEAIPAEGAVTIDCLIDPGSFRQVESIVIMDSHDEGSVAILEANTVADTAELISEDGPLPAAIRGPAPPPVVLPSSTQPPCAPSVPPAPPPAAAEVAAPATAPPADSAGATESGDGDGVARACTALGKMSLAAEAATPP